MLDLLKHSDMDILFASREIDTVLPEVKAAKSISSICISSDVTSYIYMAAILNSFDTWLIWHWAIRLPVLSSSKIMTDQARR